MTDSKTKPVANVSDGSLKGAIWKNPTEKGFFYTVDFSRTYTDKEDGNVKSSSSFSGTQLLQVSRLADKAYGKIGELRAIDKAAALAAEAAETA